MTTFGKTIGRDELECSKCMQPDLFVVNKPATPDRVKRFIKPERRDPGVKILHYGTANDPVRQEVFGKKNQSNGNAGSLVSPPTVSEALQIIQEQKESIYASTKKEPLGKSTNYSQSDLQKTFGMKTLSSEQAQNVIFPKQQTADSHHNLYVKSHKSYAPGEQVNRNYAWESTRMKDPHYNTFGSIPIKEHEGVKKSIQPSSTDKKSGFNTEPAFVSKIYADFCALTKNEVGKTKPTELVFSEDYVFGKPTPKMESNAAKSIRGEYSFDEQEPDTSVGVSHTPGWRNVAPAEKVFGVPTIRNDLNAPKHKSIADVQNYGNEPDAKAVVFPAHFTFKGLNESDFDILRSEQELQLIYKSIIDIDELAGLIEVCKARFVNEIAAICKRDRNTKAGVSVDMIRRLLAEKTCQKILNK